MSVSAAQALDPASLRRGQVLQGRLEQRDKNAFTTHLGSNWRQFRLRIDGRWYFCCADDFADGKPVHIDDIPLGAHVTFGALHRHGRDYLAWLIAENGTRLAAPNVIRRTLIFLAAAFLTLAGFGLMGTAMTGPDWLGTGFLRGVVVVLAGAVGFIAFCVALVTLTFLPQGLDGARRRLYAAWLRAQRS